MRVDGSDWVGNAFEKADLCSALNDGGQVLGAFIVARSEEEFVIYLRCNWISPVHAIIRYSVGLMIRKLSVTSSQ